MWPHKTVVGMTGLIEAPQFVVALLVTSGSIVSSKLVALLHNRLPASSHVQSATFQTFLVSSSTRRACSLCGAEARNQEQVEGVGLDAMLREGKKPAEGGRLKKRLPDENVPETQTGA